MKTAVITVVVILFLGAGTALCFSYEKHQAHAAFRAQASIASDALSLLAERNTDGVLIREPAYLDAEKAVQPLSRLAKTPEDQELAVKISGELEYLEAQRGLYQSVESLLNTLKEGTLADFNKAKPGLDKSIATEKSGEEYSNKKLAEIKSALAKS